MPKQGRQAPVISSAHWINHLQFFG
jgi:hypothetical protein